MKKIHKLTDTKAMKALFVQIYLMVILRIENPTYILNDFI